jgi:hypothetical protein
VGQHEHMNGAHDPGLNGVGAGNARRDVENVWFFLNHHNEVRRRRIEVVFDRRGVRALTCGLRSLRVRSFARDQNDGDARLCGRSEPWEGPGCTVVRVGSGASMTSESSHAVEYARYRVRRANTQAFC